MDTQENSCKWGGRRKVQHPDKLLPLVKFTTETSLADKLKQAKRAGCDLVIIDTPPGRSSESVAAVEAADLVLIPFEAEDIDAYDGVPKTARLARSSGKPATGILNKATPNSRSQAETARYVLNEIKLPMVPVVLHRYRQHRDANPKGLTAQELEPNSRAAAEVSALWDWICAELQLTISAQVHKSRRKAS